MENLSNATNETENMFINYFENEINMEILNNASGILGSYASIIISFFGLCINIFLLVHLNKQIFSHKMYDTIRICTVINAFICFIGIGYLSSGCTNCDNTKINTHAAIFYQWYIINIPLRGCLIASALAEINLIINRFLIISNIDCSFILNLSKKVAFTIMFSVGFFMFMLPCYLTIQIVPIEDQYTWTVSNFGKNEYVPFFFTFQLLFDTVIPVFVLLTLTVLSVIKSENLAEYKKVTLKTNNNHIRKNKRFPAVVIVMSCIFTLTRTVDLFGIMAIRMRGFGLYNVTPEIHSIINFYRMISMTMIFAAHSFNNLILMALDKKLNSSIRNCLTSFVNKVKCLL